MTSSDVVPEELWQPFADVRSATEIGRFTTWVERREGRLFDDYRQLWRWSVDDVARFWRSVWDYFQVQADGDAERVLVGSRMPDVRWFPDVRINYAERALIGHRGRAILAHSQTRAPIELSFDELRDQVGRARRGLERLGVGPGDRVAAYLPNTPEAIVAFLATASLGAVWAGCAPEFGPRSVISRFAQVEPKVLVTVGGYGYRNGYVDRLAAVEAIRAGLPSLERVVAVPYGPARVPDAMAWQDLLSEPGELTFEPVSFDHPLCILFSSGTTGLPKAIVHGHGGLLLEHLKCLALSWNVQAGGSLMWFTTTAWMMWNMLVSGLLLGASIVLVDGDPLWPGPTMQWSIAEAARVTVMGVSPAYLVACEKRGLRPKEDFDLSSLRVLASAGSPLPVASYRYVYAALDPSIALLNGSGGTDICTGLVGGTLMQPVYAGEMSGPSLGVDADAADASGRSVVGELGELVVRQPMPSMPVGLWGDRDGSRLRASYFDLFPGVWRQGDWVRFTERGSCVITGRSDATLNRGGVRLGTGEMYAVLEGLSEIVDALVVHVDATAAARDELLAFIALADDCALDDTLRDRIRKRLREELSPRHVPDRILAVPALPRTLTGKRLETPVKRILQGAAVDAVIDRDAISDPGSLAAIIDAART